MNTLEPWERKSDATARPMAEAPPVRKVVLLRRRDIFLC